MGLPVVCTPEATEGLAATTGRDLLVADSPLEMSQFVLDLLLSPELRRAVGQAGRAYVETHHRWPDAVSALESVYAEAAADSWTRPAGAPS